MVLASTTALHSSADIDPIAALILELPKASPASDSAKYPASKEPLSPTIVSKRSQESFDRRGPNPRL
jgi:hypothetical protein